MVSGAPKKSIFVYWVLCSLTFCPSRVGQRNPNWVQGSILMIGCLIQSHSRFLFLATISSGAATRTDDVQQRWVADRCFLIKVKAAIIGCIALSAITCLERWEVLFPQYHYLHIHWRGLINNLYKNKMIGLAKTLQLAHVASYVMWSCSNCREKSGFFAFYHNGALL